jgi:SAM-dependent methyltransferase
LGPSPTFNGSKNLGRSGLIVFFTARTLLGGVGSDSWWEDDGGRNAMLRTAYRSALGILPSSMSSRIRQGVRGISKILEPKTRAKTYNETHVNMACQLAGGVRGKSILVVGASHGGDCKLFIERGAGTVHGLDIVADIGSNFQHERVTYHKGLIENSGLNGDSFDLVFATATMEHVHDIEGGFREMIRLAKPGGVIFSIASPLWNSPYGHHMGCFQEHPWIHVALNPTQILAYAREHNIAENNGHRIEDVIEYMMNPEYFNMRKAADYTNAVARLTGLVSVTNTLHVENDLRLFDHPLSKMAREKLNDAELLAVTHEFSAKKADNH